MSHRISNVTPNAAKIVNFAYILDAAAGSSADYAYDTHGVRYPFALELRDTGFYGFQLPPEQIMPTAEETFNGIKAAVSAMVSRKV